MELTRVQWALKNDWRVIAVIAFMARLTLFLYIPVDWNSDSYHHWMISYYTLHIGVSRGRMWDLLGSDYYWGMIPHLIQSFFLWFFRTSSIQYYRFVNLLMGSVNSVLVYHVARRFYSIENARWSGLVYAIFPVSVVFDSLAMQDTVALGLVLGSLYFFRERFFWSGALLGLACHCRVEYTVVSLIVLTGFIFMEKLESDSQPLLIGWFAVWVVPSLHIWTQTGNPVYPLYYSLYSVFGGYTSTYKGLPFTYTMSRWVFSRWSVWGGSTGGILVILSIILGVALISYIVRSNWFRYQPLLFFSSTLIVLSPLVLPYLNYYRIHLLMMLRFVVPSVAFGLPPLFHLVSRFELKYKRQNVSKVLRFGIVGLFLTSLLLVPEYHQMQETVLNEFNVAYNIASYYPGGGIVLDTPSMVYRLSSKWGAEPEDIISNLYSPHYYGVSEPEAYLDWLRKEDVSLWCYYGERGDHVWDVLSQYPGLLVNMIGEPRTGVYIVDQTLLDSLL